MVLTFQNTILESINHTKYIYKHIFIFLENKLFDFNTIIRNIKKKLSNLFGMNDSLVKCIFSENINIFVVNYFVN